MHSDAENGRKSRFIERDSPGKKAMEIKKGHSEKAEELFALGYNCSQAVYAAFAEEMGMSVETAARLASGLGGGVGRLREVCGAVTGMTLVLSALYGGYAPEDKDGKAELYKKVQFCAGKFKEENGSIVCRDLTGLRSGSPVPADRNESYYHARPCKALVGCAAGILEEFLRGREN